MKRCYLLSILAATLLLVPTSLVAQDTSKESNEKTITAKVVDGKIIILDGSGKERVIDLGDGEAGSLVIEQQVESDGKKEKRSGRAIIVGPDGKQQIVELEGLPEGEHSFRWRTGPQGRFLFGGDGNMFSWDGVEDLAIELDGNKFMIGVSCDTAGDALKEHLEIENGLVVQEVVDESPAAKAGVKQFDILVSVNGNDLSDVDQLVEAVQKAGEDQSEIKLVALRKGKKVSLEVKPEERETGTWQLEFPAGENAEKIQEKLQKALGERGGRGLNEFRVERFGPGIIQGHLGRDDMQKQIEELKAQLEELQKVIKEMKDN